jgi:hypothetical protein
MQKVEVMPGAAVNVPIPDPSLLTTEQLRRELSALRDTLETRLNGMDKASDILIRQINRAPSDIENAIQQLKDLNIEKFESARRERDAIELNVKSHIVDLTTVFSNRIDSLAESFNTRHVSISTGFDSRLTSMAEGIQKQFDERDVRSKAGDLASQVAVGAALQAQKEAAGAQNESNSAAITKSESATVKQIDGILALLNSNASALNDKIAVINGRLDRGEGKQTGSASTIAMIIAGVAVMASVVGVAVTLSNGRSQAPTAIYQQAPDPQHGIVVK